MAKGPYTDSKGTYVVVVRGDTLFRIAKTHGNGKTYKQLASLNNIKNPNLIHVNQKIYISKSSSGSGSSGSSGSGGSTSSSTKPANTNKATIDQFGELSNVDNTLFATWTWSKDNTESYKVLWLYETGNGVWLVGNNSTNTVDKDNPYISRQSTYSIPTGARQVKFKVKPISKKKTKNGKETSYWTAEWSTEKLHKVGTPLETPEIPTVTIEKLKLTATLTNINVEGATGIEFEVVKDNASSRYKTAKASIVNGTASYSCTIAVGGKYKVRCRAVVNKEYSEWTGYSEELSTIPATPGGITTIRVDDETSTGSSISVYLKWKAEKTATHYEIEYTTNKKLFDTSDQTTTVQTKDKTTEYYVTGLGYTENSNNEYFFRVRAINSEVDGDNWSGWTEIKSVVIGKAPEAPTTWSSTTTAIGDEGVYLYWVHNAEDGSKQTKAHLKIKYGGTTKTWELTNEKVDNSIIYYKPLTASEVEEGKTYSVKLKTNYFGDGTKITWTVTTEGATKKAGKESIPRTIDIYAKPQLAISIMKKLGGSTVNTITSFPFYIKADAEPDTQAAIGYHLSIVSNEIYDTIDSVGRERTVGIGEEVYSKYFEPFELVENEGMNDVTDLLLELTASSIDLENNISYTAICTVSMDSGLTAEASANFKTSWDDKEYEPNAEISFDEDTYTAYIRPYCENVTLTTYKVTKSGSTYTKTTTKVEGAWADWDEESEQPKPPVGKTTTGETVYSGVDETGESLYFCTAESKKSITDVLLSVYRREFDGSFVEIASNLDGKIPTTVTDPHPSLDMARYRIVAIDGKTDTVSYYDTPGYPVNGKSVIIQWEEAWTDFEIDEEDSLEQPAWSGSLLELPYNIDISDNSSPDVARVEYIGREHPITYYGTQLGHTANWNMEIEKSDKETLYALRRLQRWMGDVYVREPSGSGYWANITVSFSQKHCEMTIPVTLSVVRVEGGV